MLHRCNYAATLTGNRQPLHVTTLTLVIGMCAPISSSRMRPPTTSSRMRPPTTSSTSRMRPPTSSSKMRPPTNSTKIRSPLHSHSAYLAAACPSYNPACHIVSGSLRNEPTSHQLVRVSRQPAIKNQSATVTVDHSVVVNRQMVADRRLPIRFRTRCKVR
jgi:hypothetical protein